MNKSFPTLIAFLLLLGCGENLHEDTRRMDPVSMSDIKIKDDFWTPYLLIHKDVTLPICVDWIENHFDSAMVVKASEGIAYSLQFENDPGLKAKRGIWSTRLKSGSYHSLPYSDSSEVCDGVSTFYDEARKLLLSGDALHADKMEFVLFNKLLAGISLKGDRYFNEFPSSSDGDMARQTWEETPSSAADLFRAVPSIGNYAYGTSKKTLWVNFYIGGEANINLAGEGITVNQTTSYPWDGYMSMRLGIRKPVKANIRIRIPSWCDDFTISINGIAMNVPVESGYAILHKDWNDGDIIEIILDMPVKTIESCVLGTGGEGGHAIRRGPLIYCMEEADNPDGYDLAVLSKDTRFTLEQLPKEKWWGHSLTQIKARVSDEQTLSLIPYFAWGNRGPGKMDVFINTP